MENDGKGNLVKVKETIYDLKKLIDLIAFNLENPFHVNKGEDGKNEDKTEKKEDKVDGEEDNDKKEVEEEKVGGKEDKVEKEEG